METNLRQGSRGRAKQKGIIWGAAAIVLLLVLAFVFSQTGNDSNTPDGNNVNQSSEPQISEQSAEETLSAFPEGFPIEAGGGESGYRYVPANSSQQQSTIEYVSTQTFSQTAAVFENYLEENEFSIINRVDEPDFAFFYATKDGNGLSITLQEIDGETKVSVSYLRK